MDRQTDSNNEEDVDDDRAPTSAQTSSVVTCIVTGHDTKVSEDDEDRQTNASRGVRECVTKSHWSHVQLIPRTSQ